MGKLTTILVCVALLVATGAANAHQKALPCIKGDVAYHNHTQVVVFDSFRDPHDKRIVHFLEIKPPTNLGVTKGKGVQECYQELHTHGDLELKGGHGRLDDPRLAHNEPKDPQKRYTFKDFLALWETREPKIVARIRDPRTSIFIARGASLEKVTGLEFPLVDGEIIIVYLPIPPMV